MSSFEINADKVSVDMEYGRVILAGVDLSEIVSEVGVEEILQEIDYSKIVEYVAQCQQDMEDDEYDRRSDR